MTLTSIHSYVAVVTQTDFKGYRKTPVASNGLKRVDDDDWSELLKNVPLFYH